LGAAFDVATLAAAVIVADRHQSVLIVNRRMMNLILSIQGVILQKGVVGACSIGIG
jgi:hypothetical protein